MPTLDPSQLTLSQAHRLLNLQEESSSAAFPTLPLTALTEAEQQDLAKVRDDFRRYWMDGKVSEGLVKFLLLAPLLRLSGFYDAPVRLTMEQSLSLSIQTEEETISGRLDILALHSPERSRPEVPFWILVIEAKNSAVDLSQGLPQLLVYAHKGLEQQSIVWGLATNGLRYQFVCLRRGNPTTYHLLPDLNVLDADRSIQLVQMLKAICRLQFPKESEIAA
jgi:hypothetical protein